jgi:hypothetical protein
LYPKRKKLFEKFTNEFKVKTEFYEYLTCIVNRENFSKNVENISFNDFKFLKRKFVSNPGMIFQEPKFKIALTTYLFNTLVKSELHGKAINSFNKNKFIEIDLRNLPF